MPTLSGIDAGAARTGAAGNRFSDMSSEDFTRIIFTELSNQDPLSPSDTGALLEQLASLRQIQAGMDLTERLKAIASQNEFASAGGLIGKTIGGLAEDGLRASGVVTSAVRTGQGLVLTLDGGRRVPMENIDRIESTAPQAQGAGGAA